MRLPTMKKYSVRLKMVPEGTNCFNTTFTLGEK